MAHIRESKPDSGLDVQMEVEGGVAEVSEDTDTSASETAHL